MKKTKIRCSCGHEREVIGDLLAKEKRIIQQSPCLGCQMKTVLHASKKRRPMEHQVNAGEDNDRSTNQS